MRTLASATVLSVVFAVQQPAALSQSDANALAAWARSRITLAGGVVSLPRAGTGELAVAFVQTSPLVVHAMASQEAEVAAARALVEATGQLARRGYVEKGAALTLPYPDNFVDLLVIADLTDAALSAVSPSEVQRVLRPGALALVGRAATEGTGLSQAAVQTWLGATTNAAVENNAQGVWAVIGKSRPAGAGDWPSRWHGPDNNPMSADANARYPYLPQWRSKPYNTGNTGAALSSGGRLYSSMIENGARILRVYRLANGQPLWTRPLSRDWPNTSVNATLMTVDQDRLYIVNTRGVVVIDGETGTVLDTIQPDNQNPSGYVKWIGIANNRLYALVGDASSFTTGTGTTIVCYDLAGNTTLWRRVESQPIGWCDMAVHEGGVFFYARNTRIACLEAATGTVRWDNTTPSVLSGYEGSGTVGTDPGMVCYGTTLFACRTNSSAMAALSTADGRLLWSRSGGRDWRQTISDDKIFSRGAGVLSTATGAALSIAADMGDGCGAVSATTQAVYGQNGGVCYLFSENRNINDHFIGSYGKKSSCDMMPIFADGIWVTPLTGCMCFCLHRGLIADAGAGSFVFDRTAVQSERLEQGPAWGNVSAQVVPDNLDWAAHRSNNSHSAYLPVTVAAAPHLRYRLQPAVPYVYTTDGNALNGPFDPATEEGPTPPVIVGERVFWAGSDGYVRCYNATTNREEWRFATGGCVYATPAVANGCVYVGSGDGYAYCLEAHTGRLVWRFRAAPVDRRINLYGHLVSSWPLLGGVLVHNGVAYTIAGFSSEFGVHAYALDAATGAIVWQNNTCGKYAGAVDHDGPTPGGYMTIVGNKLWARAAFKRNFVFDLATGALQPVPSQMAGGDDIYVTVRGREIGVLDERHVVFGGMPVFSDANERWFNGTASRFLFRYCVADAQGNPLHPEVQPPTMVAPTAAAWDGANYYNYRVVEIANTYTLERWNKTVLNTYVDSRQSGTTLARPYVVEEAWNTGTSPSYVWRRATNEVGGVRDIYLDGLALAANRLVATYSKGHWGLPAANTWYLGILDTSNGQTTWETALPGLPLHDGIALGRNGDIYVMLQRGDLLCYGSGPAVSVAARSPQMPVVPLSPSTELSPAGRAWSDPSHPLISGGPGGTAGVRTTQAALSTTARDSSPSAQVSLVLTQHPVASHESPVATGLVTREALGTVAEAPRSAAPQPAPRQSRDMRWTPARPCLTVRATTASSCASGRTAPSTADRDLRTHWAPAGAGPQWLVCDLGSLRDVSAASVVWYSAKPGSVACEIEVSADGATWEQVDTGRLQGRGTLETVRSFVPVSARYVRVALTPAAGASVPRVCEVGIHGDEAEVQVMAR